MGVEAGEVRGAGKVDGDAKVREEVLRLAEELAGKVGTLDMDGRLADKAVEVISACC